MIGRSNEVREILQNLRDFGSWVATNPSVIFSIISLVFASLSLLFTLFSFRFIYLRRGKIRVGPPRVFEINNSLDLSSPRVILRLPLVFFNDGAVPIVIQNIQLVFPDSSSEGNLHPFRFWATTERLTTKEDEGKTDIGRRLAYQFPVKGREAVAKICEFWGQPGELIVAVGSKQVMLMAKLGDDTTWQRLATFTLRFSQECVDAWTDPSETRSFIAFANSEDDVEMPQS